MVRKIKARFEMRMAQMVCCFEDHDLLQFPSVCERKRKLPYLTEKFEDMFFMTAMVCCMIIETIGIVKICLLLRSMNV